MPLPIITRDDQHWGHTLTWAKTAGYCAQMVHLNSGHSHSFNLQSAAVYVLMGRFFLTVEDTPTGKPLQLFPGSVYHLPNDKVSQITADGQTSQMIVVFINP